MRSPRRWSMIAAMTLLLGPAGVPGAPLHAQTAVTDSAEFTGWSKVNKEDLDGLREKFMALAKAVPPDMRGWRPMNGTRSFREVFAHIAAEGNTETGMFGRRLPTGSLADFDAEEARLKKLPDDQLIAAMDRGMQSISATIAALPRATINKPITYYGQSTLPRVAVTYTLMDLHEHLGQLVAYARMNQIVPPWSKKS